MILADTSVWVDHLRRGNDRLTKLLLDDQVLCHPFIVGELACGRMKNRTEVLGLLRALPEATTVHHDEALAFVETRRLMAAGIGWIDIHLLASTVLTGARLWTLDANLMRAATALRVSAPTLQ